MHVTVNVFKKGEKKSTDRLHVISEGGIQINEIASSPSLLCKVAYFTLHGQIRQILDHKVNKRTFRVVPDNYSFHKN